MNIFNKIDFDNETHCWVSKLSRTRGGYTQTSVNGKAVYLHRYIYELTIGPIPEGLQLDHLCRNRACANPYHLEPVTPKENTARSPIHDGVLNKSKTHCKRGHEFTAHNTILSPWLGKIRRSCKICHRASVNKRKKEISSDSIY